MILRICSTFLYMVSCVVIALSTPQTSWVLYPAVIFLSISGFYFYVSNLQTANLFPKLRGTIVNVINGALTASMVVFTLVKQAYQGGISLQAIFLFMASLGFLFILRTVFLMPKLMIPYDVPSDFQYGIKEYCSKKMDDEKCEPLIQEESKDHDSNDLEEKSLKSCIMNSLMPLVIFSSGIQWLRENVFIESLNVWLKDMIPNDPELLSLNISVFGYVELSGIILAPLNGMVYDTFYHHFEKKNASIMTIKLKTLAIVCLISSSSAILYSVFVVT